MRVAGDSITFANARAVAAAGLAAIEAGDACIDCSGVQRCDSTAVACVLAWMRAARRRGVALALPGMPAGLRSLAGLYGVAELLPQEGA